MTNDAQDILSRLKWLCMARGTIEPKEARKMRDLIEAQVAHSETASRAWLLAILRALIEVAA